MNSNVQFVPPYTISNPNHENMQELSKAPTEVSIGNWLLTFLVLIIPLVNIVMLFVWSFADKTNESKRNYCKAMLIASIVLYSTAISLFCLYLVTNLCFW